MNMPMAPLEYLLIGAELMLVLIGGRLELYAIIIVLNPKYWTHDH